MCGQWLVPLIRTNIVFLAGEECFEITPDIRENQVRISRSTDAPGEAEKNSA